MQTLTLTYAKNYSPVSRDSLAGILDTSPLFAEQLTKPHKQVTATNDVSDYTGLPRDLVVNTHLVDDYDAQDECNRQAALWAVPRKRYRVPAYLGHMRSRLGKTVKITYPGKGFEEGVNARVVRVGRALSRFKVELEVWF